MIRTKHPIDTRLLTIFITDKIFDAEINELLIEWYSSLGDKDHQKTRNKAIDFLKKAAVKVLTEIDYPHSQREEIIKVFEPLELLLRTALPLQTPGDKAHNVRDHLSHTIRNILFSNYILKKFNPANYSGVRMQLIIAVIFHDLAYPLEKIKKVAHKLGNTTFSSLNSKGNIEIELANPDDLLTMLDFFGRLIAFKEAEVKHLREQVQKKPELQEEIEAKKLLIKKLVHIYREVISKAIAGIGLFDSSHSISSVVLFLTPVIKTSKDPASYQDQNLLTLCDICLSMTYHDRGNFIQKIDFPVPVNLRILRITDELQEWDRESNSYVKGMEIENDVSAIISLDITMRDKSDKDPCKPELFLPDKINGLWPVVLRGETIKLAIHLPSLCSKNTIEKHLSKMEEDLKEQEAKIAYKVLGRQKGKLIEVNFKQTMATIKIK